MRTFSKVPHTENELPARLDPPSGRTWYGTVICGLFALCPLSRGAIPTPTPLHYKVTASPSGRYHFEVDPTERYGVGPSHCRLTEGARVLWSAEIPFTFSEAAVLDDGRVAGYGCTCGVLGWTGFSGVNEWRAAIFDPSGKQILNAAFPRIPASYPDGPCQPTAPGMFIQDGLFNLRLDEPDGGESWHQYHLESGGTAGTVHPVKPDCIADAVHHLEEALPVEGIPLIVLRWSFQPENGNEPITAFSLADSSGKCVWELPPGAVPSPAGDTPDAAKAREELIARQGAVSKTGEPGTFTLLLSREAVRATFRAVADGGAWRVEQTGRQPLETTPPGASSNFAEVAAPGVLGRFALEAPPPDVPVRSVDVFGFDGKGRIGFLREGSHFVLVEQTGAVVAEIPVQPDPDGTVCLTWVTGNRWVFTSSRERSKPRARAWWIDAAQKSVTEIPEFGSAYVQSIAGAGSRGFVALREQWQSSTPTRTLTAYDSNGQSRWNISISPDEEKTGLLGAETVTITGKGETAVLDNVRHNVVFFDSSGKKLRSFNLDAALSTELNYPTQISADRDGGIIIGDFRGDPPFARLTGAGKLKSKFNPSFPDGRKAAPTGEIHIAPDGRPWLNNGHSLLRLDDRGRVTAVLGQKPDSTTLVTISSAAGNDQGHVCVSDGQTRIVHVFDDAGRRLRICRPGPPEKPGPGVKEVLAFGDDGRIFLNDGCYGSGCVIFDSAGKLASPGLKCDGFSLWVPWKGTGGILCQELDTITLTDESRAVNSVITRQPDRRWLDLILGTAVAPDGSFTVLTHSYSGNPALSFYASDGKPRRTIPVPDEVSGIDGWNGTHLLLRTQTTALLCDRDARPLFRLPVAPLGMSQFLTRHGTEWWTLDFATRIVSRHHTAPQ